MHLRPILKGLHRLCFKCLNHYNPLFATNEREKHLHTSNSTCSTLEASTSTHRVAHVAGKEDCPSPPQFLFAGGLCSAQLDCELRRSPLDSAKWISATAGAVLADFTICAAQLHLH